MSEEQQTPEVQEEPTSSEERARGMGWVPKEEFRGAEEKWIDADAFIERGEKELPILRERYRKQEKDLAEVKRTVAEFSSYVKGMDERSYKRALKELEQKRDAAVEEGDKDVFKKVDNEIKELQQERAVQATQPATSVIDQTHDDLSHEFAKDHASWFKKDNEMTAYSAAMYQMLLSTKPELYGTKEFYSELGQEVRRRFPDKFGNPKRDSASSVHGGGNSDSAAGPRMKSFNDLPADAKAMCIRFEKQGLLKREQYVKDYFEG